MADNNAVANQPAPSRSQEGPTGPEAEPQNWYTYTRTTLIAVRAPVLAASAYFAVVAVPDQSAEAARIMLGWHLYWAIGAMLLWWLLTLILVHILPSSL